MSVVTDPIADMLSRMKNACTAQRTSVDVPLSQVKMAIAKILHRGGYVRGFQLVNRGRDVRIRLKYDEYRRSVLCGVKRISKPGRRVYAGKDKLERVLDGIGLAIISTSQGLMTGEQARQRGIGGEVICHIW